jgi:putative ABC transport system permease protein
MMQDVRFALRQLLKNPGFAAVAVLTLALGIGAASAMFGLIQGVLLSPPPYAQPDRLVLVAPVRSNGQPYNQRPTTAQWLAWRTSSRTIDRMGLYRWSFNFLVTNDGSESLGGMLVTQDYFRTLGLRPSLGREFTDNELARGNTPPTAIIIGHDLWRRKFNSDPRIIGSSLRLSRMPAPLPIVGVMPPGVRFLPDPATASEPNYDVDAPVDFWLAGVADESQLRSRGWNVVARLKNGVTADAVQTEIAAISDRVAQADSNLAGLTGLVRPLLDELNREGRRLLLPLFGSVALVFLIACGNVAGLLLARGLQRQPEYAMRSALGAARIRLFRQLIVESVTLALVGATAGAGIAAGIIGLLKAIGGHAIPRVDAVSVGWPVFAAGLLAALLASVLAGLLPAARASRVEQVQALDGARTTAGRAERRLLGGVAALQIVMTVALLCGAGLLIRTARNLASIRPGYDTEKILAMTVTSVQQDKWKDFHTRSLERVAAVAGVTHAAFVWGLPLTGNKWSGDMEIVGQTGGSSLAERLNLPLRAITPAYFDAMGMRLVDGRAFRSTDDTDTARVAVINEAFARSHLRDVNPIGRQLRFAGDAARTIEIVGVVADTRTDTLSQGADPEVYLPLWQSRAFSKHLIVRAAADPRALASAIRGELRAVDPTAAVEHVKTMGDIRAESIAPRTFAMHLLTGFSIAATLLALVGLYGVLSLSVGSRMKELAVRKAIGAQRSEIVRLILGEAGRLIGVGVATGIAIAVLFGRVLGTLLFEVPAADPLTLAAASLTFVVTAFVVCAVPAWRAARVDLMHALRHE